MNRFDGHMYREFGTPPFDLDAMAALWKAGNVEQELRCVSQKVGPKF